jgi:hypothetical protein
VAKNRSLWLRYTPCTPPPQNKKKNTHVRLWRREAELDEGDLGVLDARRRPARVRCRVRQQQPVRKLRVVNRAPDPIGGNGDLVGSYRKSRRPYRQ